MALLLGIILWTCIGWVSGLCPTGCICDDVNLGVACFESSKLSVIPITLNPDIIELNITGTLLSHLDAAFQFYGELKKLDLSFNRITSLEERCFENQAKLISLNLSFNYLTELKVSLSGLQDLEVLNLKGNRLVSITNGAFKDSTKLSQLILSDNSLASLNPGIFIGITSSLRYLEYASNPLQSGALKALKNLPRLFSLDISRNPNLSLRSFFGQIPKSLISISLSDIGLLNYKVAQDILNYFDDLQFLDLSKNPLEDIVLVSSSLQTVILDQNKFKTLNLQRSFSGTSNLQNLIIRNQKRLTDLVGPGLSTGTLRSLTISGNPKLSSIPDKIIFGGFQDINVDLSYNDIKYLRPKFSDLHLNNLDLWGNPMVCDCEAIWLRNITDFLCPDGVSIRITPKENLYCLFTLDYFIWVLISLLIVVCSFCSVAFLVVWTRRSRMNKRVRATESSRGLARLHSDLTWRSKCSTSEFFYEENPGSRYPPRYASFGTIYKGSTSDFYQEPFRGHIGSTQRVFIQNSTLPSDSRGHDFAQEEDIFYVPLNRSH